MTRILVVGGGIGGLTTAIALRKVGVDVTLVERASAFTQVGAGITIQANAHAVLRALGVTLDPDDTVAIGHFQMVNERGRVLMSGNPDIMPVKEPSVNIHRADLHRNLLAAAEGIPLEAGVALEEIHERSDGVEVLLSNGRQERWDAVVGADGLHSTVRHQLYGDEGCATRYSGQTCWRFACDAKGRVPPITVEHWRVGQRAGVVPLSRDRVYVYLVESASPDTPAPGSAQPEVLWEHFGGWKETLDPILELVDGSVPVHHGDLVEHASVRYGRGRVLLLGDAAHAMTPNMGQGAGTAIEDAGTLALLWSQRGPALLPHLAEEVAAQRSARVEKVKRLSWNIGAMAHWRAKPARWLRDLLLRSMPRSLTNRQALAMWQPGLTLAKQLQEAL